MAATAASIAGHLTNTGGAGLVVVVVVGWRWVVRCVSALGMFLKNIEERNLDLPTDV